MRNRNHGNTWMQMTLAGLLLGGAGCKSAERGPAAGSEKAGSASAPVSEAVAAAATAEMNAGLGIELRDPIGATAHFRKVLELNPNHYGATYQMARALELGNKSAEARPYWEAVLKLATASNDKAAADVARERLAYVPTVLTGKETDDELVKLAMDQLYGKRDAVAASHLLGIVLERSPEHYGGNFQRAMALDVTGPANVARAQWERVLRMATKWNDVKSIDHATGRIAALAQPQAGATGKPAAPTAPPSPPNDPVADAAMQEGLDALYKAHDPASAIPKFRAVLARNPEHYGAHYQLAVALGKAGQAAEARAEWERVLVMAQRIHDDKTANQATAELAAK